MGILTDIPAWNLAAQIMNWWQNSLLKLMNSFGRNNTGCVSVYFVRAVQVNSADTLKRSKKEYSKQNWNYESQNWIPTGIDTTRPLKDISESKN